MIDIRYFRVIFWYCKIRPHNRKNFAIDRSKILVKRWFFLNYDFNSPLGIVLLLFNHFAFTEICKELKLQRETSGLKLNNFGFKFQQVDLVWNHQAIAYGGFINCFAVNCFGGKLIILFTISVICPNDSI